jgi:hypothetical protein
VPGFRNVLRRKLTIEASFLALSANWRARAWPQLPATTATTATTAAAAPLSSAPHPLPRSPPLSLFPCRAFALPSQSFRRPGLVDRLVGCYVPNLVALPFSLDRYFAEEVVRRTASPDLVRAISSDAAWAAATQDRAAYARTLVIELLSFQFASPVLWVATQHFFFTGAVAQLSAAERARGGGGGSGSGAPFPPHASDSPALAHQTLAACGFTDDDGAPAAAAAAAGGAAASASPAARPFCGIRRLVEIGPQMTLLSMASRTIESG